MVTGMKEHPIPFKAPHYYDEYSICKEIINDLSI